MNYNIILLKKKRTYYTLMEERIDDNYFSHTQHGKYTQDQNI